MKSLLVILLFLTTQLCSAQDLVITGKVDHYELNKDGKIYYTELGKRFSPKTFIRFDKDNNYSFKIGLNKIKNKQIKTIVFANDTSAKSDAPYACVYKINVGEIVNSSQFLNAKSIKLKSDLLLDNNCIVTERVVVYLEEEKFVGKYQMQIKDTSFAISLDRTSYRYTATLSKQTPDYMDKEFGSWNYDKRGNILTFNVWEQKNERFGLIIRKRYTHTFEVVNNSGKIEFKGIDSNLIKL